MMPVRVFASEAPTDAQARLTGERLAAFLFVGVYVVVLLRTAWMADDAFIDLRVASNFVSGFGLRWNVAERVEVFTDPTWVLLVSAAGWLTREWYFTVLALCILLSTAAVILMLRRLAADWLGGLLALCFLLFSKAFVEYSTSGLHEPLVLLLLALFWAVYRAVRLSPRRRMTLLSAVAGLLLLTDPIASLLTVGGLAAAARALGGRRAIAAAVPGAVPILAWSAVSLVYYGFFLPNPAYAAWTAGPWPAAAASRQGLLYVLDLLDNDPLTLLLVAGVLGAAASRALPGLMPAASGIALSIAVLLALGGDAHSGQSMAAPVFVAALALAGVRWSSRPGLAVAMMAVAAAVGIAAPRSPVRQGVEYGKQAEQGYAAWRNERPLPARSEIADERFLCYPATGLLTEQRNRPLPDTRPLEWTVYDMLRSGRHVMLPAAPRGLGLLGFVAGPRLHIVDAEGRCDLLLARLRPSGPWKVGGTARQVPAGYVETLETGRTQIADANAAALYQELKTLSAGPLLAERRVEAILDANRIPHLHLRAYHAGN